MARAALHLLVCSKVSYQSFMLRIVTCRVPGDAAIAGAVVTSGHSLRERKRPQLQKPGVVGGCGRVGKRKCSWEGGGSCCPAHRVLLRLEVKAAGLGDAQHAGAYCRLLSRAAERCRDGREKKRGSLRLASRSWVLAWPAGEEAEAVAVVAEERGLCDKCDSAAVGWQRTCLRLLRWAGGAQHAGARCHLLSRAAEGRRDGREKQEIACGWRTKAES